MDTAMPYHLDQRLLEAAEKGETATVERLIAEGANTEATNKDGWTPLHYACCFGHTDTARLLLDKDANVDAKNKWGTTPLHCACYKGHTDTTRLLLDKDANTEATYNNGWTPLHYACQNGHTDTVKLLLENGAMVDATNEDGITPLHSACYNGHTDTARLLLENGANVDATDKDSSTPLHVACCNGHTDTARLLLDKDANVDAKNKWGTTPLHCACYKGHTDTTRLLLDKDANTEATDKDGYTPLHLACCFGYTDIARLLLDKGANRKVKNNNFWVRTPAQIARWNGYTDLAKLVETYQVRPAPSSPHDNASEVPRAEESPATSQPTIVTPPPSPTVNEVTQNGSDQSENTNSAPPLDAAHECIKAFYDDLFAAYQKEARYRQREAWLKTQPEPLQAYYQTVFRFLSVLSTMCISAELGQTRHNVEGPTTTVCRNGLSGIASLSKMNPVPVLGKFAEAVIAMVHYYEQQGNLQRLEKLGPNAEQAAVIAAELAYSLTIHRAKVPRASYAKIDKWFIDKLPGAAQKRICAMKYGRNEGFPLQATRDVLEIINQVTQLDCLKDVPQAPDDIIDTDAIIDTLLKALGAKRSIQPDDPRTISLDALQQAFKASHDATETHTLDIETIKERLEGTTQTLNEIEHRLTTQTQHTQAIAQQGTLTAREVNDLRNQLETVTQELGILVEAAVLDLNEDDERNSLYENLVSQYQSLEALTHQLEATTTTTSQDPATQTASSHTTSDQPMAWQASNTVTPHLYKLESHIQTISEQCAVYRAFLEAAPEDNAPPSLPNRLLDLVPLCNQQQPTAVTAEWLRGQAETLQLLNVEFKQFLVECEKTLQTLQDTLMQHDFVAVGFGNDLAKISWKAGQDIKNTEKKVTKKGTLPTVLAGKGEKNLDCWEGAINVTNQQLRQWSAVLRTINDKLKEALKQLPQYQPQQSF